MHGNIRRKLHYSCRTSYASNYFYGRIRWEGLLRDAERHLLAIAKFVEIFVEPNIVAKIRRGHLRCMRIWYKSLAIFDQYLPITIDNPETIQDKAH